MEFKKAELDSFRNKLALAVSIIRNKPAGYTSEQYCYLLQSSFYNLYTSSAERIDLLKHQLFETRKKLFVAEHKEIIDNIGASANDQNEPSLEMLFEKFQKLQNDTNKRTDLKERFNSRLELMVNLIKLKSIEKNLKLNENTKELIADCLSSFLKNISEAFFNLNIKQDHSDSLDDNPSNHKACFKEFSVIPIDSILHSLQVFLNVYDIEWFYYLRSSLIESIETFTNDLISFILNYSNSEKNNTCKLQCATQMIIIVSTSDYLLNPVLYSIIRGLHMIIDYICNGNRRQTSADENADAENIAFNCWHLTNCIEFILNIRNLDNFSVINNHVKEKLYQTLNTIFINLTDVYPLLAIKLSKLMQFLNFTEKKTNRINQ